MSTSTSTTSLPQDDLGPIVLAVVIIFCILSCIVLIGRLYTRLHILHAPLEWDDFCIIFAVLSVITMAVLSGLEVRQGVGKHVWALPDPEHPPGKYERGLLLTSVLSISFTKASILLQLLRLTLGPDYYLRVTLCLCLGTAVGTTITALTMGCISISATVYAANCSEKYRNIHVVTAFANTAANTATDFMVWIAPIPVILKLQLQKSQKIMLVGLMTLSSLTWIVSLVRLRYVVEFNRRNIEDRDLTYEVVPLAICTTMEANSGIVFASVLTLRPIVKRWWPRRGGVRDVSGSTAGVVEAGSGGGSEQSEVELAIYHSRTMTTEDEEKKIAATGAGAEAEAGDIGRLGHGQADQGWSTVSRAKEV